MQGYFSSIVSALTISILSPLSAFAITSATPTATPSPTAAPTRTATPTATPTPTVTTRTTYSTTKCVSSDDKSAPERLQDYSKEAMYPTPQKRCATVVTASKICSVCNEVKVVETIDGPVIIGEPPRDPIISTSPVW